MTEKIIRLLIKAADSLEHHIGSSDCDAYDEEDEDLVRKINELPEVKEFERNKMNIPNDIKILQKQEAELKERLKALLKSLPEPLPGVNMLGPHSASVSLSTIAKHGYNLSPRYYLSIVSKEMLLEMVEKSSINTLTEKIERIINTGTITIGKNHEKVHPAFVKALKKAWEGN